MRQNVAFKPETNENNSNKTHTLTQCFYIAVYIIGVRGGECARNNQPENAHTVIFIHFFFLIVKRQIRATYIRGRNRPLRIIFENVRGYRGCIEGVAILDRSPFTIGSNYNLPPYTHQHCYINLHSPPFICAPGGAFNRRRRRVHSHSKSPLSATMMMHSFLFYFLQL